MKVSRVSNLILNLAKVSRGSLINSLRAAICFIVTSLLCLSAEATSYAIVIGITEYKDPSHWARLPNGRNDAEKIIPVLKSLGFTVKPFLDGGATRSAILSYAEDQLASTLTDGDRVLFFFSGHGVTTQVGSQEFGYLVPVEGNQNPSTWISMDNLREVSAHLNAARHQLFILVSCFGGQLGLRADALPLVPLTPQYVETLGLRRSRIVIAAGGAKQKVADAGFDNASLFTAELIRGLGGLADTQRNGFISTSEIYNFLLHSASTPTQTPSYATLVGDESGQMLFKSPLLASLSSAATQRPAPQSSPLTSRGPAPLSTSPAVLPESQPVAASRSGSTEFDRIRSSEEWQRKYNSGARDMTYNVIVASPGVVQEQATQVAQNLQRRYPNAYFETVHTASPDWKNEQYAIYLGTNLSQAAANNMVAWAKAVGIAADAYPVLQHFNLPPPAR